MLPQTTAAPSKNALRVLRQLALAGSTLGSVCAVAAVTYDTNRRIGIAQQILQNKRAFQTFAPYYDATSAARRLSRMLEAAEAGNFEGLDSLSEGGWSKNRQSHGVTADSGTDSTKTTERGNEGATEQGVLGNSFEPSSNDTARNALNDVQIWLKERSADVTKLDLPNAPSATNHSQAGHNRRLQSQSLESARELFDSNRIIEAAEMLLENHLPKGVQPEPLAKNLAISLFYANCRADNVFIARQLFRRLVFIDAITPRMWEVLILALANAGYTESAARLYLEFSHEMELPKFLAEVVLRCLLESQRLTHASRFMYRNLRHDVNCGLSGLYLSTLWKKTRSIDALNQQFEKLLSLLPRFEKQPTEKLFNPMIRAYVQFGLVKEANALAEDMQNVYNIPLSCRTKGLLLYAEALRCNWDGVERGLQEMHDLGMTLDASNFRRIFDSIFLEYWPTHDFNDISSFFIHAVETYGLVPDRVLFKHVIQAFVEKGGVEQVDQLLELAITRKWPVEFDEAGFMKMLQRQRHALQYSPVGFWQMLNAARIKYGQTAFSRQILGHDQRSVPHPLVNRIPHKTTFPNWYRRMLNGTPTVRPMDQYIFLDKQMAQGLHTGNAQLTWHAFDTARKSGYVFKVAHIELAIIATIVEERGLLGAQKLVKEHWNTRRPVVPKFFSQIEESDPLMPEVDILKMIVFRFYNICWEEPALQMKHHFLNSLLARMIRRGQSAEALDIMITVYQSRWARQLQFNGTSMKLFIRLFGACGNLKGVRWCILTALSRDSACNDAFLAEMRRVIASLRMNIKQGFREQYLKRRVFHDHLEVLADTLENKMRGDPELATLQTKVVRKRFKPEYALHVHKWHDNSPENLRRIVEEWDEHFEMDYLLRSQGTSFGRDPKEPWDEQSVLQEPDEYFID